MPDVVKLDERSVTVVQVLDGKTYQEVHSMLVIPDAGSKLVKEHTQRILGNLNLDTLITNLARTGQLLFVAYNGVAGFGKLRAAVTTLQDKLSVLCGDCELALSGFERSADEILKNLKQVFSFLLKGKEDWALKFLAGCAKTAEDMSNEANTLAGRFDELGNLAVTTLNETQVEQGNSEQKQQELKEAMEELEAKTANAKILAEQLAASKEKLQRMYEEAKEMAEKAENRAFGLAIANAIMKPLGEGLGVFAAMYAKGGMPATIPVPTPTPTPKPKPKKEDPEIEDEDDEEEEIEGEEGDETGEDDEDDEPETPAAGKKGKTDSNRRVKAAAVKAAGDAMKQAGDQAGQMSGDYAAIADGYRKEKMRFLELLMKEQEEERKTLAAMAEYAVRMKNVTGQSQIAEATTASLFQAVGALKQVSVVLRTASIFWKNMAAACKALAQSQLKDKIELFKDDADRLQFYLEDDFKLEAVNYYAGWKALSVVSHEYSATCARVREQVQTDITKNPSTEESRKLAPVLGAKLLGEITSDISEIDQRTKQARKDLEQAKAAAA